MDDVARTLARAEALLCPQWQERTGPGERRIPAPRAPDGMLVYRIGRDNADAHWSDDFHLNETQAPADGPGLRGIDHIAQALQQGAMDRFILFYRSIFGFEAAPAVELADRLGLIRSRALSSRNGKVRIPLNVSEGEATETDRFITASSGAGIHHIAFAAGDIKASLESDAGRGLATIPIPGNYYEDLTASAPLDKWRWRRCGTCPSFMTPTNRRIFSCLYAAFRWPFLFRNCRATRLPGLRGTQCAIRLAAQARLRQSAYKPAEFR